MYISTNQQGRTVCFRITPLALSKYLPKKNNIMEVQYDNFFEYNFC